MYGLSTTTGWDITRQDSMACIEYNLKIPLVNKEITRLKLYMLLGSSIMNEGKNWKHLL